MRVTGLDGRPYVWSLQGGASDRPTSGPHREVRAYLKRAYPLDPLVEEVVLPGSGGLRADFFLPRRGLIVEVQGRQHDEFVHFFHGDRFGFSKSLARDEAKRQWCSINGLSLAELHEDGSDAEWRQRILDALRGDGVGQVS